VAHRARLTRSATPFNIHQYVQFAERVGELEWLPYDHPQRLVLEV
jgi:hypothetical protein